MAQLAVRAYKQLQAYGCPVPSLEEWRHDETWKATGHTESFTRATQKDYTLIYNRFAAYLGYEAIRDNTYTEMDKALHILRDSMQRFETGPDYLAEVVRDQLHLPPGRKNSKTTDGKAELLTKQPTTLELATQPKWLGPRLI